LFSVKHLFISAFICALVSFSCSRPVGNSGSSRNDLRIAFYNVENLFDTIDTPDKQDSEFTPESKLGHDSKKYIAKREHIIQVLEHINADLIGLCEVENRFVVEDLVVNSKFLSKKNMQVSHFESPDFRGIDNAIIYNLKKFEQISAFPVKVNLEGKYRTTRDILIGIFKFKSDTICVYVNHWPSRSGGQEKSEPKRMTASKVLRSSIDSLKTALPGAYHIILGDLNDYPNNKSTTSLLVSGNGETDLINLMIDEHESGSGSHNYRGEWGVLDHIIISRDLEAKVDTNYIFKRSWMLFYSNSSKDSIPSRYYGRDKCYGGYSDHLPVVLELNMSQENLR